MNEVEVKSFDRSQAESQAERINEFWRKRGRAARARALMVDSGMCRPTGEPINVWTVRSSIKATWSPFIG